MKKYGLSMRRWIILLIFLAFQSGLSSAQPSDTTAFTHVTVIPMDSLYTLTNYTVIIGNDRIIGMGLDGNLAIPDQACRIDGQDKYLMPGLADMHIHTYSDWSWIDEKELILFIANGVTTVRNMFGDSTGLHLKWRERIKTGSLFGPTLYTTCPIVDGDPPAWPGSLVPESAEQARQMVSEQKALGYDFIKVYNQLTIPIYDAIISEAKMQNIPVVGHVPWPVGLEHVITSGQKSVEHLTGYEIAFGYSYPRNSVWEEIDSTQKNEIISMTVQSGMWNCPTLVVIKNQITDEEFEQAALRFPYMRYVPKVIQDFWKPDAYNQEVENWIKADRANDFYKKLLKTLYDHGANILLGTDCVNAFTVPGFSLHDELQLYVEAGFTPYETIKIATYNAAEFCEALDEFGTVSVGKRADLILLNKNPLENVKNVQDRIGVMVRGKWYTEEQLQDSLQMLANRWNPPDVTIDGKRNRTPADFALFQNHPNPFNPTTTIEYDLSKTGQVRLVIYSLLGRQVKTLEDSRQPAGHYRTVWDGTDDHSLPVAAGLYFCRMEAGDFVKTIKLALIR